MCAELRDLIRSTPAVLTAVPHARPVVCLLMVHGFPFDFSVMFQFLSTRGIVGAYTTSDAFGKDKMDKYLPSAGPCQGVLQAQAFWEYGGGGMLVPCIVNNFLRIAGSNRAA